MTTCPKCNIEMLAQFVAKQKLPILVGTYKFACTFCTAPLFVNITVPISEPNFITLAG